MANTAFLYKTDKDNRKCKTQYQLSDAYTIYKMLHFVVPRQNILGKVAACSSKNLKSFFELVCLDRS